MVNQKTLVKRSVKPKDTLFRQTARCWQSSGQWGPVRVVRGKNDGEVAVTGKSSNLANLKVKVRAADAPASNG